MQQQTSAQAHQAAMAGAQSAVDGQEAQLGREHEGAMAGAQMGHEAEMTSQQQAFEAERERQACNRKGRNSHRRARDTCRIRNSGAEYAHTEMSTATVDDFTADSNGTPETMQDAPAETPTDTSLRLRSNRRRR